MDGRTIRVNKLRASGFTLTAVAYNAVQATKYSAQPTGGAAAGVTPVPLDSLSPATSEDMLVAAYTGAPTAGAAVGVVAMQRVLLQATTAVAGGPPVATEFDFTAAGESDAIVLRSMAECVGLCFASAPATAVTLAVEVEWTEEA